MSAVHAYDPVFSAFIFKALLPLTSADQARTQRLEPEGGYLENMAEAWELSIKAAQLLDEQVHPESFEENAVFAYEFLEGEPADRLAQLLRHGLHQNTKRGLEAAVVFWIREQGLRTKH